MQQIDEQVLDEARDSRGLLIRRTVMATWEYDKPVSDEALDRLMGQELELDGLRGMVLAVSRVSPTRVTLVIHAEVLDSE